jgi:hypothetical protein
MKKPEKGKKKEMPDKMKKSDKKEHKHKKHDCPCGMK